MGKSDYTHPCRYHRKTIDTDSQSAGTLHKGGRVIYCAVDPRRLVAIRVALNVSQFLDPARAVVAKHHTHPSY